MAADHSEYVRGIIEQAAKVQELATKLRTFGAFYVGLSERDKPAPRLFAGITDQPVEAPPFLEDEATREAALWYLIGQIDDIRGELAELEWPKPG